MTLITKTFTFSPGASILSSEHNTNFNTIYDDYNGNITNSNLKSSAAIADTKIAQITTANKVHGSSLTNLDSVASGAGALPSVNGGVPTGVSFPWTTDTAPTGYLLCDGSAVSRTTFAALFTVISTTYGIGDGSTTFNVPDVRGRVPLGQDDMGGSSANRVTDANADSLGGTGGSETTTVSVPVTGWGTTGGSPGTITSGRMVVGSGDAEVSETLESLRAAGSAQNATGTNTQPWLTLNYIIKT